MISQQVLKAVYCNYMIFVSNKSKPFNHIIVMKGATILVKL